MTPFSKPDYLEKEQRLRNFMRIHQEMPASGDMPSYDVILSSRSWRLVMALHRIKNRVMSAARQLGLRR